MALVKEIEEKGAMLAWSPVPSLSNLVALGTKESGGAGFDNYGGELEIHALDWTDASTKSTIAGSVKTNGRFQSIAWSGMGAHAEQYTHGIIAGGMTDGTINIWDPAKLVKAHPQAQLSSMQPHRGAVNGLQFNPHPKSQHLLASGGSDGTVYIHALDAPDTPKQPFVPAPGPNTAKHTGEVTKVAWNSQVAHILASSSQDGSCLVWDLRAKKPWCELRDATRGSIADIAWNPLEGLQIVTACGDDQNPTLKMWDLRSSTTLPLATLQGHEQGLLSISWCPQDTSLLMSCGKDNKTILWDLFDCRPIYELPVTAPVQAGGGFGGFGASVGRRYFCDWSPKVPAVLATCSFDRKVQVYNMSAAKTTSARAPKWMRRPAGATFGFGGKLASFTSAAAKPDMKAPQPVRIAACIEDDALTGASQLFEQRIMMKDYKGLCETKATAAEEGNDLPESQTWRFMQIIFEDSARERLLQQLGFNADQVQAELDKATAAAAAAEAAEEPPAAGVDAAAVFGGDEVDGAVAEATEALKLDDDNTPPPAPPAGSAPAQATPPAPIEMDESVKRALVVGNFPAAVEGCFQRGQLADALLLASCGGAELWEQTRDRYFKREAAKRPEFLNIVTAIITSKLSDLVTSSHLADWRETLAILSTYGKSEEFPILCEQLGARLEAEADDKASAALCYMCAVNVPKTVKFWIEELNKSRSDSANPMALHAFIEKVSIFTQEDQSSLAEDPETAAAVGALFTEYGAMLANQGAMETALKYISANDSGSNELRHRLFYASAMEQTGAPHPPLPFEQQKMVGVSPNFGKVFTLQQQQQQQQQEEEE